MGSTSTKFIKGREYLYYVYYESRKKREIYCGLASKSESEKKALRFELEQLTKQKKSLSEKVIEVKSKIKSM